MQFFGLFSLIFGAIIIAFPEFLAYLIGFFFVLIGVNILFISTIFRRGGQDSSKSWKVGGYEIIKNRK
ncbi:hypothetical protein K2X92_04235 [Candidatus Gracilibacteria bacterium]|nr:hypothetical protein [Candidatus Gracilibacteria bacterium]